MFESLMQQARPRRRVGAQAVSVALHAGVLFLLVRPSPVGRTLDRGDPVYQPLVTYDHAAGRTPAQVEGSDGEVIPSPVCDCPVSAPGPLRVDLPGLPGPLAPGIPTPGGVPGIEPIPTSPAGEPGVYRVQDLSEGPAALHVPPPAYPPALRAAGLEGTVVVTYVVGVDGRVEAGSLSIESAGHALFGTAVEAALMEARFRPGRLRGTPVRSLVRQVIRFSLMPL